MSASAAVERSGPRAGAEPRDYNHVSDPQYIKFRDLADQAYKKKTQLSQQSQEAYKAGDGAKAHQLSEESKKQAQLADGYNFQAAEYVFVQNNADSASNQIDLHGLYVKEAEYVLKRRIVAGLQRNETVLQAIVGKGLHSKNGVAKLKPAIEELCQEAALRCELDPKNSGILLIYLTNARIPDSWNQIPAPTAIYQPQGKPQYQQHVGQQQIHQNNQTQGFNQQQNLNNNGNQNGNNVGALLLKLFCFCVKKYT